MGGCNKFREQKTVPLVNHALARVTPAIFVIFVVSRGSSSKALVLPVRMQIRHFRRFRQEPPRFGGTKARFTKGTAFGTPTNGGLRGVWPPFPEVGRSRPFSPFFCLFRPFPESLKSTWEIQKTEEKGTFPQVSSDFLKPPSLKPPFAAPQLFSDFFGVSGSEGPRDSC